ncbi:MAG TPA: universal stress protein [Gemmatimonadales bacterium]
MARTTVLVGVDISPDSVRAAALGVTLATASDTECRLIHAVPDLRRLRLTGRVPLQQVRHDVRHQLEIALRDAVPKDVLERHLYVAAGRPAAVLAAEARRNRAWVVVVGGKHHGPIVRNAGGSTAHHLIRTLRVPVLVAGPSTRPVQRVLAAVDLSPAARPTLKQAQRLATLFGAELRILHVVEPIRFPTIVPLSKDEAAFARASEVEFDRMVERVGLPSAMRVVRRGEAADTVAAEAREWGADLVVVGSHGKAWVERLLIGSATEALLNRLPAALVVVPTATRVARRRRRVARLVI